MPARPIPDSNLRWVRACDRSVEILLHLAFVLIPVFFIILTRDQFELPKLTVLRVLTALMLGLWAIRMIAARQWGLRRTPLDLPIAIWLVWQIVTTLHSASISVSWLGEYENFRGLLTQGNYVVLYYLIVNFIRTRAQIDRLLFTLFLTALLVTGYGVAQFFGIDFIAWNPESIAPGRYFSSLGNPNFLAAYLAMIMPLVVVFFVETPSLFRRVLLFISFIIMFVALLGTWSRGGLLGLIAALTVLAAFGVARLMRREADEPLSPKTPRPGLNPRRIWVTVLVLAGLTLALLAATIGRQPMARMTETIFHFKQAVTVSRLHIWVPALGMIRDHFFMGTGLDTFKSVFPRYATPAFAAIDGANVSSRTAHNEILQVLATQGVIGFLLVAWLTVVIGKLWLTAFRASRDRTRDRLILIGLLAGWTAYSVQNLFSFGVAAIDTLYWAFLAVLVLLQDTPEKLATGIARPGIPSPLLIRLNNARSVWFPIIALGAAALAWQGFRLALADYQYNLGTVYRMRQQWDPSIQAFRQAARLSPHEVKYAVYTGLAYEEKAKTVSPVDAQPLLEQAIAHYTRGVQLNPTNAYYLGNLGRAFGLLATLNPSHPEAKQQSVRYFKSAIHYAPVTVLFYQNLGMQYYNQGDAAGFREVLQQLAAFNPKEAASLAFTAGNQYYSQQKLDLAVANYQEALRLNPEYVEAHFNLGVALAQNTNLPAALVHWQKALAVRPDFEPARQMLHRYQQPAEPAR